MTSTRSVWRQLTRDQDLLWIVRHHGVLGTARWLRRSAPYYLWLHLTPAGRRESAFDRIYGVETDGMVPRWEMGDLGPNLQYAVQYLPSRPRAFRRQIDSLPIDYSDFTFIDIGAGKGRVLLMASQYSFRRIVGVEFSPKLCEIARRNLKGCDCCAEVHCVDATQYAFPAEPLVVYMCNPFGVEPMAKVAQSLERSLAAKPRLVYVVYWNAFHPEPFARSDYFVQIAFRRNQSAVFRSRYGTERGETADRRYAPDDRGSV